MGEHQQGVIVDQVSAHKIFLNLFAVGDGQFQIAFLVHDVHRGGGGPAVEIHGVLVSAGGVASAVVGGVALHNGAAHLVDHGLHKVRAQEVLVAWFAGVELDGHLAGKLYAQSVVQAEHGGRGEVGGEVYFGIHGRASCE